MISFIYGKKLSKPDWPYVEPSYRSIYGELMSKWHFVSEVSYFFSGIFPRGWGVRVIKERRGQGVVEVVRRLSAIVKAFSQTVGEGFALLIQVLIICSM